MAAARRRLNGYQPTGHKNRCFRSYRGCLSRLSGGRSEMRSSLRYRCGGARKGSVRLEKNIVIRRNSLKSVIAIRIRCMILNSRSYFYLCKKRNGNGGARSSSGGPSPKEHPVAEVRTLQLSVSLGGWRLARKPFIEGQFNEPLQIGAPRQCDPL